jgi:pyruvate/2-oxoglutarate dehydrogenase complex dihydrolipoamide acyltransferase (E2) component
LVSPAIAVLFLGATYEHNGRTVANLVLTFDHRLINGVEAAQFMKAIVETAEQPDKLVKG